MVELNKSKISGDTEIILAQLPTLQPVITKRHFHQTGTLRIYQKFCIPLNSVKKSVDQIMSLEIAKVSAGAFIFLVQSKEDTKKEFKEKFNELAKIKFPNPIILGCSENYKEFFNYALELAALKRALTGMKEYEGEELVAVDLRSALNAFGEIVGETTSEDLLTRIFSEFCIGK